MSLSTDAMDDEEDIDIVSNVVIEEERKMPPPRVVFKLPVRMDTQVERYLAYSQLCCHTLLK
jgi:hypothetical protein